MLNLHCSVVAVNGKGVLIKGPSGSGKSSVAMGLIDTARALAKEAILVSDDQALVYSQDNEVYAQVPDAIAGKIEVRGLGICDTDFVRMTALHVVCEIVEDHRVERMPDHKVIQLCGINLPHLRLPRHHEQHSVRIVLAYLGNFVR